MMIPELICAVCGCSIKLTVILCVSKFRFVVQSKRHEFVRYDMVGGHSRKIDNYTVLRMWIGGLILCSTENIVVTALCLSFSTIKIKLLLQ